MGLDMYLFRRKKGDTELPESEECYWRKANQIRRWIVEHTEYPSGANCVPFVLSKVTLDALVEDCCRVLANHELAPEVLPPSNGFYFGSTAFDEWYYNGLAYTVRSVSALLASTNFDEEEVVYYEWY